MTDQNCGASREEWDTLAVLLGLQADLLPVVSNMQAAISPMSTMKDLGKVPSRYNRDRQAVGIPQWTQHVATDADMARWVREPDYGICIQTREVRALDVDVPDQHLAGAIGYFIYDWLGEYGLPRRERANSGKFLLAFRMPGTFTKRVIKVEGGIIEFLANGQQFIAIGTHPSGARYEWTQDGVDGLPDDFPTLESEQFERLWAALAARFAVEAPAAERAQRDELTGPAAPIDMVTLRSALDAIPNAAEFELGYEEWLHVIMALHHETAADAGGLAMAHEFSARSAKYDTDEVDLEWGRINGVTAPGKEPAAGGSILLLARRHGWSDAEASVADFAVVLPPPRAAGAPPDPGPLPKFLRKERTGQIACTMDNLVKAIDRRDMTGMLVAHDRFRDEIMFSVDAGGAWQAFKDHDTTVMRIALERRGFEPPSKEAVRDAMLLVAQRNAFDSAQLWLGRQQHDGAARVETFLPRYFGTDDTPYTRAVSRYIWTAMAGRVMEPGCQVDMAPILVGDQGLRKSSALAAMVPDRDFFAEISFSEKEDDLSRKMRGMLLGEIAEMKGLHGRDSEWIKAWMTKRHENWTPKFKEFNTRFPRRSLFIGTANKPELLVDKTGHRRWLPATVGEMVDVDAITRDRDQMWAEGAALFMAGGVDFQEAEELAKQEHDDYRLVDEWEPIVAAWLAQADELSDDTPGEREYLTTHDVLSGALQKDAKNCTRSDEMRIGDVLRTLGYARRRLRQEGYRPYVYMK